MIISLSCKKEESERERQGEVGRETESKRDLKQIKLVLITSFMNYKNHHAIVHECYGDQSILNRTFSFLSISTQ